MLRPVLLENYALRVSCAEKGLHAEQGQKIDCGTRWMRMFYQERAIKSIEVTVGETKIFPFQRGINGKSR